eukprot:1754843-Rhodomonas_salina.2
MSTTSNNVRVFRRRTRFRLRECPACPPRPVVAGVGSDATSAPRIAEHRPAPMPRADPRHAATRRRPRHVTNTAGVQ